MKSASLRDTSASPRFYRPELDALRFLAFVLVFLRHTVHPVGAAGAAIAACGQSGVCLFFLLSAYLITELLEREVAQTSRIDLRSFYIRRILRIWPLYFAALLLARLIDFHAPHLQMSNGRLAASVLLAGNWYTYWYGLPASFALVLWSVSVEEQFYLFWPSLRSFLGRRAVLVVSIATFPISYAAIVWLCAWHRLDIQIWVNTFVQLQFFGLGGMLALQLRGRAPRLPSWFRLALFCAGLFAFFSSEYYFHGQTLTPRVSSAIPEFLMMALGSLLLFFSALGLSGLRHAPFLIYLGKISYGLYVFHILAYRITVRFVDLLSKHARLPAGLLETIHITSALALTILMASLSYIYFESAFLRLKQRFEVVRTRAV